MKHALLVGVTDEHPEQRFNPEPSLKLMTELLQELGGWTITPVDGPAASREGIFAALARLEQAVGPGDSCLFYFIGHGGIMEIQDLAPPIGGHPVFYIATARPDARWILAAILDIELSLQLARIERVCGDVSVILDCCYSARATRSPVTVLAGADTPDWLRHAAEQIDERECDALLSPTSDPRIVRLTAASALRTCFPEAQGDEQLGRLTRLLVETVREAQLRVDRLTWDAVAHRVRERAIWSLGCEEQWVSLAGPRQRLLFSPREAPLPWTVGFVPRASERGGWIRAGELQGVRVGDEWGLAELTLDDELRPRERGRMRVVATDLNRAELEAITAHESAPPGTSALLLRARDPATVIVEGPAPLAAAVAGSAWLEPGLGAAPALRAGLRGDGLELREPDDHHAPAEFANDTRGVAAAIERLEDWARSKVLLAVAESRVATPNPPIALTLGRYCREAAQQVPRDLPAASTPPTLHVGDRIYLRAQRSNTREEWFVNLVEIDVAGRPMLLDASEPDGRELLPGEAITIGWRAHRSLQGIELTWPAGAPTHQPRLVRVIMLASRRPIQLGHLVHGSPERQLPRDIPRQTRTGVRGRRSEPRPQTGPELARDWAAAIIPYVLDPRPRLA